MPIKELDHIVLNVGDVERSLAWYTELLGLTPERVDHWRAGDVPFPSVRISDGCIIDLFASERSGENMDHLCLVADRADIDRIATDDRFTVVEGPVGRWGARGDGWAVHSINLNRYTVGLRSYDEPLG